MYFPKSQITPNLYTNGEEFCLKSNKSPYKGYYYKLSSGKFFTGKTPQDGLNEEIIEVSPISPLDVPTGITISEDYKGNFTPYPYDFDVTEYPLFTNEQLLKLPPTYSPNLPTEKDYQIGEFIRYFCKKTNDLLYLEISKDIYNKLVSKDSNILYQQYQPFNVPWKLTGVKEQVFIANKNIVELTMKQQKLPKFDLYLKKDYIKYYK